MPAMFHSLPYLAFALFFLCWLSIAVIRARGRAEVYLGTGEDPELLRLTRAQGNFVEYAPLTLLGLLVLELAGAPWPALHVLGVLFILSRVLHAQSVSGETQDFRKRILAMKLTFAVLSLIGLGLVLMFLYLLFSTVL